MPTWQTYAMSGKSQRIAALAVCASLACVHGAAPQRRSVLHHVNPFVGTQSNGGTFPGATLPHGLVQLSPVLAAPSGADAKAYRSGYHRVAGAKTSSLLGFGHTALSGVGVQDGGDFLLRPCTGGCSRPPSLIHSSERASPGFYGANLLCHGTECGPAGKRPAVSVNLTATLRGGLMRMRFMGPSASRPRMRVSLASPLDAFRNGSLTDVGGGVIEGWRASMPSDGCAADHVTYWHASFDPPFDRLLRLPPTNASDPLAVPSEYELEWHRPVPGNLVVGRLFLSHTSIGGALRNMAAELPSRPFAAFEAVREKASAAWDEALSAIALDEQTPPADLARFYTALYHAHLGPTLLSDADGAYPRGHSAEVLRDAKHTQYSSFDLGRTYRALHPLLNLIAPGKARDFAASLLSHTEAPSSEPMLPLLPSGPLFAQDSCAGAYPAATVLTDMALKGLISPELARQAHARALAAAKREPFSSMSQRKPAGTRHAVSGGLEAAIADSCIGRLSAHLASEAISARPEAGAAAPAAAGAAAVGAFAGSPVCGDRHDDEAGVYTERGRLYRLYYDEAQRLLVPTYPASGNKVQVATNTYPGTTYMAEPFYERGTSLQYLFTPALTDPQGLAEMLGGREALGERLDDLFQGEPMVLTDRPTASLPGSLGGHYQGHEPGHHTPYLYNVAGRREDAQHTLSALQAMYTARADGLPGADASGQLSAWLVFTMLGLYPSDPCAPKYELGRPFVPSADVAVASGLTLRIRTVGLSPNATVQRVSWNDAELRGTSISHADVLKGGTLTFHFSQPTMASPYTGGTPRRRTRVVSPQRRPRAAPPHPPPSSLPGAPPPSVPHTDLTPSHVGATSASNTSQLPFALLFVLCLFLPLVLSMLGILKPLGGLARLKRNRRRYMIPFYVLLGVAIINLCQSFMAVSLEQPQASPPREEAARRAATASPRLWLPVCPLLSSGRVGPRAPERIDPLTQHSTVEVADAVEREFWQRGVQEAERRERFEQMSARRGSSSDPFKDLDLNTMASIYGNMITPASKPAPKGAAGLVPQRKGAPAPSASAAGAGLASSARDNTGPSPATIIGSITAPSPPPNTVPPSGSLTRQTASERELQALVDKSQRKLDQKSKPVALPDWLAMAQKQKTCGRNRVPGCVRAVGDFRCPSGHGFFPSLAYFHAEVRQRVMASRQKTLLVGGCDSAAAAEKHGHRFERVSTLSASLPGRAANDTTAGGGGLAEGAAASPLASPSEACNRDELADVAVVTLGRNDTRDEVRRSLRELQARLAPHDASVGVVVAVAEDEPEPLTSLDQSLDPETAAVVAKWMGGMSGIDKAKAEAGGVAEPEAAGLGRGAGEGAGAGAGEGGGPGEGKAAADELHTAEHGYTKAGLRRLLEEAALVVSDQFRFKEAGATYHVAVAQRLPFANPAGCDDAFAAPVKPSAPNVSLAIFTLIRGGVNPRDYSCFVERTQHLRETMERSMPTTPYDDLAFHEGNVPPSVRKTLAPQLRGLRWIDARAHGAFSMPHAILKARAPALLRQRTGYSFGYRHMCRFFAMQWVLALKHYEYAMRVDDDVLLHHMEPLLQAMRSKEAVYGYALYTEEKHVETVDSMNPWLAFYMASRGLRAKHPSTHPEFTNSWHCEVDVGAMYFTNFFLTKTAWWTREDVQSYLRAVDLTGSIYSRRWGDAPIQSTALRLFAPKEKIIQLNVSYTHYSTGNEVVNGKEEEFKGVSTGMPVLPESFRAFLKYFNGCAAPCAVYDAFRESGPRVKSEAVATKLLKQIVINRTGAPPSTINDLFPIEVAKLVQFEVFFSDSPLPPDSVSGVARRHLQGRLATGKAESDDWSDGKLLRATMMHPCCVGKSLLDLYVP